MILARTGQVLTTQKHPELNSFIKTALISSKKFLSCLQTSFIISKKFAAILETTETVENKNEKIKRK